MERSAYDQHPQQANHHPPPPGLRDEARMGNTVLTVSGCFKRDTTATAADKMAKVLEAEIRCQQRPGL